MMYFFFYLVFSIQFFFIQHIIFFFFINFKNVFRINTNHRKKNIYFLILIINILIYKEKGTKIKQN